MSHLTLGYPFVCEDRRVSTGWLVEFMNEEQSESVNHWSVFKPSMKPKNPQFVRSLSTASLLVHHLREGRV